MAKLNKAHPRTAHLNVNEKYLKYGWLSIGNICANKFLTLVLRVEVVLLIVLTCPLKTVTPGTAVTLLNLFLIKDNKPPCGTAVFVVTGLTVVTGVTGAIVLFLFFSNFFIF
uniref:Uncharacterized protein n=1 Tax=Coniferiporia sulphurascens TaxID=175648 RepID=A0A5B9R9S1_CONSH|nr:hypothetical protein PSUO_000063 [Coniferiporia sulphurascens]QEG57188.1 hypothetical protein PSUO_000063 [Coniferiporia sulphurascens]